MKGILKKTAAALLSLAVLCGAGTALPAGVPLFAPAMTARAEESDSTVFFDEANQTLHLLSGDILYDDVRAIWQNENENVRHIIADSGSVLPENCNGLFMDFQNVETIDLSKVDSSNVTVLNSLFANCMKVTSINLSNFDTSEATLMESIFNGCEVLESVDVSSFDTSKAEYMNSMFNRCKAMKEIDLSSFDTSNLRDMGNMFSSCTSLTWLDLSSFSTGNVSRADSMFASCSNLRAIIVSDGWDLQNMSFPGYSYKMFDNCINLKGGMGTPHNSSKTDKEYARIDTRDLPGYLSGDCNIVKGASLTLDGTIGINFYTRLSADAAAVVLDGPEGEKRIADFDSAKQPDGSYKFSYGVNTLQADEPVFISVLDADGEELDIYNSEFDRSNARAVTYSVNEYINDSAQYTNDAKLSGLVRALDNYCKAAENYFIGTSHELLYYTSPIALRTFYSTSIGNDHFDLAGCKMALVLNSATAVRIYSSGDEETAKLTHYGHDTKPEPEVELTRIGEGENAYFEIENIPAQQIIDTFKLTIGEKELVFMPLNYGYLAATQTTDEALRILCSTVYDYTMAANRYFY